MSSSAPLMATSAKPCDLPSVESTRSFWHSQPSPLLTGHRSTRNLPSAADIVIIGSGITGASVAHHLLSTPSHERKPRVLMLEAREACWGATGRNGGHCQPLFFNHPHDPSIGRFELRNFYAIQDLVKSKNIDCDFVVQPSVHGSWSQELVDRYGTAVEIVQNNAPEIAPLIQVIKDPDELARLRMPTALAAIIVRLAARLWPYKFVARILEDLVTSEQLDSIFNLQTLTPVESVKRDDDGKWVVHTSRGDVIASKVVLATNAYTSHLLRSFADLITPGRGQMSALEPPPSLSGGNRLTKSYGFVGEDLDDYLMQRSSGNGEPLMYGGGGAQGHLLGTTDDSEIDEKTANYLRTALFEHFSLPEGKNETNPALHATHMWTGIMGYSRDNLPWVGPVPNHPGLFISAGYNGHGMPNTWLCGKAIAIAVQSNEKDDEDCMLEARTVTGLPASYIVTEERMRQARELQSAEHMHRGTKGDPRSKQIAERPPSGYA